MGYQPVAALLRPSITNARKSKVYFRPSAATEEGSGCKGSVLDEIVCVHVF